MLSPFAEHGCGVHTGSVRIKLPPLEPLPKLTLTMFRKLLQPAAPPPTTTKSYEAKPTQHFGSDAAQRRREVISWKLRGVFLLQPFQNSEVPSCQTCQHDGSCDLRLLEYTWVTYTLCQFLTARSMSRRTRMIDKNHCKILFEWKPNHAHKRPKDLQLCQWWGWSRGSASIPWGFWTQKWPWRAPFEPKSQVCHPSLVYQMQRLDMTVAGLQKLANLQFSPGKSVVKFASPFRLWSRNGHLNKTSTKHVRIKFKFHHKIDINWDSISTKYQQHIKIPSINNMYHVF